MERSIRHFAKRVAANGEPREVQQGGWAPAPERRNYRGVTRRPSGKYGAYIYELFTHNKVWLGTYNTREEAACAYDAASRTMRPHAKTNFPEPAGEEETRRAVVRAHVGRVKRQRDYKMQQKEARRKIDADNAAATAAVAAVRDDVQPPPAPAQASDASGSQPAPAPAGEAFESQYAPAPAVGVSSIRLFGVMLAPGHQYVLACMMVVEHCGQAAGAGKQR